jgi:pyruvate-formate lyase-activating enzyme
MNAFPRCIKPWTNIEIDDGRESWGYVRPCCWSLQDAGRLFSNSLLEIWNGPGFVEYRRRMLSGDLDGLCPDSCPGLQPSSAELRIYLSGLVRSHRNNDFLNLKEILLKKIELQSLPVYMKVSPTLACNLRCIMCYQSHETTARLSDSVLDQIVDLLPSLRLLRLQGGEIFASQAGMVFLRRISAIPVQPLIGLITNATFPIPGGLELLDQLNIQWVICSLDASCSDVYKKIRIGGTWEKVMDNLSILRDKSKRKHGFKLFLSMTVMTVNMNEIRKFVEFAHELDADVVINPLNPDEFTADLDPFRNYSNRAILTHNLQDGLEFARTSGMTTAVDTIKVMQDILLTSSPDH